MHQVIQVTVASTALFLHFFTLNYFPIPSMAAWRALIGSTSAMRTRAPNALKLWAYSFPTSPYPATTHTYINDKHKAVLNFHSKVNLCVTCATDIQCHSFLRLDNFDDWTVATRVKSAQTFSTTIILKLFTWTVRLYLSLKDIYTKV